MLIIAMAALLILIGYLLSQRFFGSGIAGLVIAIVLWAGLTLYAYYRGDRFLLRTSGAQMIAPDAYRRLYNVVREMKIASGLERVPDIYVIDDPALNSFAIGRDPSHASIVVTVGLLVELNREELQGVIAHEMAHIKNRDVLLMTMSSILLGILAILASRIWLLFSGGATRSRRGSSRTGCAWFLNCQPLGFILILTLHLILLFGALLLVPVFVRLIHIAISRKREYLADACAALYTRYPEGLASALEKIGNSTRQLRSANRATASMFIINPYRQKGMRTSDRTSTHPPLSQRISILRNMAGASLGDYNTAYCRVHGGKEVITAASAAAGAPPLATAAATAGAVEPGLVQRARETSDVMWKMKDYRTLSCDCGTRLRVPPEFKEPAVRCPHCGKPHVA